MTVTLSCLATLISSLFLSIPSYALNPTTCNGTNDNPCIVQDTDKNTADIKSWRTARMISDKYQGNTYGLKNLWLSASGAPSVKNLEQIAHEITIATNGRYRKIVDLDLRQENHGYLNHQAITLNGTKNWINLGKTYEQTLNDEKQWLEILTNQPYVFNVLSKKQFKIEDYSHGVNIKMESLISEQDVAEKLGFLYMRLTITDHMAPRNDDVDRFVSFVKSTSDDVWVHIHCRGGKGRATTFFAMYDMLKNADKVSFNDIIKRQASVDPYYDLSQINNKDPDLIKFYKARLVFLAHFYQFASASLRGYLGSWSDWLEDNDIH